METKIIKAVFGGGTSTVTNKRTRTDYGQVLEIIGIDLPDTFECIFSNSNTSAGTGKKMIGSNQRCLIPDEYLATGQPIYAWILLHDTEDDGRHMYSIRIPVADMPDTSPEEPTPVEQSVISQAITVLNSAVTTTTQKAQEATESADRAEQAAEGVEGYAERAESAQQAAESARDRATQAETSARTSAATASEKASEAISSATTASRSALNAENASESAQEYATASAESASQASQSADTASGKASDASEYASNASTSAQTASQKALEAAQSAQAATQAKTDAQSAKTASQTAQGLAESARDNAITAKTSAEDARDEAQDIVDGITGKVEQIDSNTDRIESLEDDRYKPYAVDSASGSIASFSDGADDIPLKSCIVQIEPVQSGSGDPSPENERPITGWTGCEVQRTGVNIWDEEWEVGDLSNSGQPITASDRIRTKNFIHVISNTAYYFKTGVSGQTSWQLFGCYYDEGKNFISTFYRRNAVLIMPSNCHYIKFTTTGGYGTTYNHDISINYPSTDHDYHSYTGQTYHIAFPSEAGTIYGGYIDPINGELVVDRASEEFLFINPDTNNGFDSKIFTLANTATPTTSKDGKITNVVNEYVYAGASYEKPHFYLGQAVCVIYLKKNTYRGGTVQACYPLAEPIHYPLTPTEIKTLLGTNNIWANTGGTEVEYRADVTKYIDRKITEAVSALT